MDGRRERALELLFEAIELLDDLDEGWAALHVCHAIDVLQPTTPLVPVEPE